MQAFDEFTEESKKSYFQLLAQKGSVADKESTLKKPLHLLYQHADQLRRQSKLGLKFDGDSYDNIARTYVLLLRYLHLVVDIIPEHEKYNQSSWSTQKAATRQESNAVIEEAEGCKKKLSKFWDDGIAAIDQERHQLESRSASEVPVEPASEPEMSAELTAAVSSAPGYVPYTTPAPGSRTSPGYVPYTTPAPGSSTSPYVPYTPISVASSSSLVSLKPQPVSNITSGRLSSEASPQAAVSSHSRQPSFVASPASLTSSLYRTAIHDPFETLQSLFLPGEILDEFMRCAKPNTDRKIETCGVLAGTRNKDGLVITTLIIPKQTGKPDECYTEDEMSLFCELQSRDLLSLGWIHTHPTQTAFLSSVDLHMHASYQGMLAEAVAVVMAPSQPEGKNRGLFRLTNPPGLSTIQSCRKNGFHPHETREPLFEESRHVILRWGKITPVIVDLRDVY